MDRMLVQPETATLRIGMHSPITFEALHRTPVDDRAVFTAIVYVLTSGCGWRELPPTFGDTVSTVHCRLAGLDQAGLLWRLHRAVLDELGSQGLIDWSRAILVGASVRAKKGMGPDDRLPGRARLLVLSGPHRVFAEPVEQWAGVRCGVG